MSLIVANDVIENVRWAHTLTDNTLDEHQYKWMSRYFGTFKFVSPKDIEGEQWNAQVYCFDSSRWAGIVDGLFERNKDLKVLYGNQRDFFVVYELTVTAPGYKYKWHRDVSRKAITGVVYFGDKGEGTILKTPEGTSQVNWRNNRGLWFGTHHPDQAANDPSSPWHKFENNSSDLRYTVNINFTPVQELEAYIDDKKEQFLHYWIHKKPLWHRMKSDA